MRQLLVLLLATSLTTAVLAAPADAAPKRERSRAAAPVAGTFVPVPQFRALDTRTAGGAVAAGQSVRVPVAGRGKIPADAAAVAVTVHAIAPTQGGMLTVFPARTERPNTINLVYERGRRSSQAALARLSGGALAVLNRATAGRVQIAVDVLGYVTGGKVSRSDPGLVHLLATPERALDTRPTRHILEAGATRTLQLGHGVPSSGVGAVAVMVTASAPAARGALVAYAEGNDQPSAPTTLFAPGHSASSFAWVPTKSDGRITIANTSAGPTDLVVDVVGWTNAGVADAAGALQPRFPATLARDRTIAAGHTVTVPVAGRGGVPLSGVGAAVLSLTVTDSTRPGELAAWSGPTVPATRALQFTPGRPASSLVTLPLGNGAIHVRNLSTAPAGVSVDVVGFVPAQRLRPPAASVSRYLGDLSENLVEDRKIMNGHGCTDAQAIVGVRDAVVLLDVGAQSVTTPELDTNNPGVSLTQTQGTVRLRYPDLVSVLDRYLSGFHRCAEDTRATIAIGTNNDGDYEHATRNYTPTQRGGDWANLVVDMLATPRGLTVVGANDIEPGFASSQKQAREWVDSYLLETGATLVFNGSADGCPDGFGQVGRACADGWTQQGIYGLAHHGNRIKVLPQIYGPSDAAKWANIDATGGGRLDFAGVLTQHRLDASTYTPSSGWSALTYAIGTLRRAPSIPAVTDIRNG